MNFNQHKKIYLSTLISASLVFSLSFFPGKGFFSLLNDDLNSASDNFIFADEVGNAETSNGETQVGTEKDTNEENSSHNSAVSEQEDGEDDITYETVSPEEVAKFKKESPDSKNFVSGQQNAVSYRNEQLNIAFDLPSGFMLYPPNMLAYLVAADEEDINRVPFDFSFFAQSYEFIAMKDGAYPKLTLVVEKEIKDNISLDDYVISYSVALKNLGYQANPVSETSRNIAGEDYKRLSFSITENGETIIQDFYFRKINDLLIYFTASYKSGEENEMETLFSGVGTFKDASPLAENSLVKDPGSGKNFKSDDSDTLFNPNRLNDNNDGDNDDDKVDEDLSRQINFNLSEADSKLNSEFTFARERLFLPTSYLKFQEKGLFINDELNDPGQLVDAKSFVNNVEVKSKRPFPYSIKLFFFNNEDEATALNKTKVYGIELEAREKIGLTSASADETDAAVSENSTEQSSQAENSGTEISSGEKPSGTENSDSAVSASSQDSASSSVNGLHSKHSLTDSDELKSNLNNAVNNSIFQAGLTFTSSNDDVKSLFDKLADNSDNKVKESSENDLTTYYALNNSGTFLQITVDKNFGLVAYKLLSFSLDNSKIPEEILNIFA